MKRLLLAALLLVLPRAEAAACTCAPDAYQAWPADGATDVPRNAAILVAHDAARPSIALRRGSTALALEVEERGSAALNGRWIVARPPVLEANTTYELAITVLGEVRVTTFTTGASEDRTAPTVTLHAFAPETMPYPIVEEDGSFCYDSCVEAVADRVSRARFEVETDAVFVAVAIDDVELATTAPLVGFHTCGVRAPAFEPDREYTATVIAYDLAGNVTTSEPSTRTARSCEPAVHPTTTCAPADECTDAAPPDDEDDDAPKPAPATTGCTSSPDSAGLLLALALVLARARLAR